MITREDVTLSDAEIDQINKRIAGFAAVFAKEGEQVDGFSIRISFVPGLGRMVDFSFSGSQWEDIE